MLKSYLIPFFSSLCLSILFTPIIKRIATRTGYMSKPREDRWNKNPIPLLGGIAIFLSTIIPYAIFVNNDTEKMGIISAGSLIFCLGLFDDIFHLKPYIKLLGQIIIAALLVYFGIRIELIANPIISIPLTIVWVVAIMNSFNLLDNMDGLSGGIGAIAGIILFIYSFLSGNQIIVLPSLILAGSLLGFLKYNFHPAQIFMGDSGSLFIGFMLGAITLQGTWKDTAQLVVVLLIPLLILAVPIFDTIFVTLTRTANSRNITQGGKDHISHRMVVLGLSERGAVISLYFISMVFGAISILSMFISPIVTVVLILFATMCLIYFAAFLGKVKVYDHSEVNHLKMKNGNVVLKGVLLYKRRFLEVGGDFIFICLAYISANLLRYEGILAAESQEIIVKSLPLVLIVKSLVFLKFGLYKETWRHVSIRGILNILKAVSFASLATAMLVLFIWRFQGFSRAVVVIDGLILFLLISGSRILERILKEMFDQASLNRKRVLIYGAGDVGEFVLRVIRDNKEQDYEPVGFLDDNKEKIGSLIQGVAILGTRNDLDKLLRSEQIDEVIIAISGIDGSILGEVISICNSLSIKYKIFSDVLSS